MWIDQRSLLTLLRDVSMAPGVGLSGGQEGKLDLAFDLLGVGVLRYGSAAAGLARTAWLAGDIGVNAFQGYTGLTGGYESYQSGHYGWAALQGASGLLGLSGAALGTRNLSRLIAADPTMNPRNYQNWRLVVPGGLNMGVRGSIKADFVAPRTTAAALEEGLRIRRPQNIGIHRPPQHHIFPQEHRQFFADRGFIDIDNYTIPLDQATHSAIHTWRGAGRWNDLIVERVLAREAELGHLLNRREIMQVGAQMRREAGLQHIKVTPFQN